MDPGSTPDEITTPGPDIDFPDPGDPGEMPGTEEAEAHPS